MGPWSHRTDVLIRRGRDTWDVCAEERPCEGTGGRSHLQARKRSLWRNLTLDIQPPQLWGNKFLISYPVRLWCFIVGACAAPFSGWVTPLLGLYLLISIWRRRLHLLSWGTRNSSLHLGALETQGLLLISSYSLFWLWVLSFLAPGGVPSFPWSSALLQHV